MTERELMMVRWLCEKMSGGINSDGDAVVLRDCGDSPEYDTYGILEHLPTFVEALRVWTEGQGIRMINVCCCPETDFTWACTIEIDGTMIHPDSANYPIEGDGLTPPLHPSEVSR